MGTLEKIKFHGIEIIEKLKKGEKLTLSEKEALKIYNSLFSKQAVNAGKRNGSRNIQKP